MTTGSHAVVFPSRSDDGARPGASVGGGGSPLHGQLAASMERLVALAATALRAPLAFIILNGDDRRCFAAGSHRPPWLAHDVGTLRRSGITDVVERGDHATAFRDVTDLALGDPQALAALQVRSL